MPRLSVTLGAAMAALLVAIVGACGGGGDTPAATSTTLPTSTQVAAQPTTAAAKETDALPTGYTGITVSNGGAIRGRATFLGAAPEQGVINCTKDCDVFGATIPEESLIVSTDGNIQNVVVFIQEITEGKPLPRELPSITNKGGRFVEHVQAFPQREFLIRSEDPVLHNTHPYFGRKEEGGRSLYNVAMSPPEPGTVKEVRRPLNRGAGMYQFRCDAHDWMRGWIWILDNPYGVVSGENGTYTIDDIPPGTYKLTAWHEVLGEQAEVEVTVTAGGTTEVNFEFSL